MVTLVPLERSKAATPARHCSSMIEQYTVICAWADAANINNPATRNLISPCPPLLDGHYARKLEQARVGGARTPGDFGERRDGDVALDDADQHAMLAAGQRLDRRGAEPRGEHAVGRASGFRRAPRGPGA